MVQALRTLTRARIRSDSRPWISRRCTWARRAVRGRSGLLDAAIADYEAIATTFAVNAIGDDKVRQQYSKHIREISDQVMQEVANGNVSFVCGPAEPACAIALVFIGSNLGGMPAEAENDLYQEELPVFMHWMND